MGAKRFGAAAALLATAGAVLASAADPADEAAARAPSEIYSIDAPAGPANDNEPEVRVGVQYASTVRIYTTPDCSGQPAARGEPNWPIPVTVPDDSTTTFRAKAVDAVGNVSECSFQRSTYREDSTGPAALVLTPPESPGPFFNTGIGGTRSADTERVEVYAGSGCSGELVTAGDKFDLDLSRLWVPVPEGQTRSFSARALDVAGNRSACSNTVSYRSLNVPAALETTPAVTGRDRTPLVHGSLIGHERVRLFGGEYCSGEPIGSGTADAFRGAGIEVQVGAERSVSVYAQGIDRTGVASGCSRTGVTYRHDSIAPDTDLFDLGPLDRPRVEIDSSEPDSTYRCKIGTAAWRGCAAIIRVELQGRKVVVLGRAIDRAGNADPTPARILLRP